MERRPALSLVIPLLVAPIAVRADDGVKCGACHAQQAVEWSASVHAAFACQECHGGDTAYTVSASEVERYARMVTTPGAAREPFDHGPQFRGKAKRPQVPERCGRCHSDVQRMNPYGMRTDQVAAYWTSGHGRTLAEKKDDRVAVCSDCHGVHDILRSSDPKSRTNPVNVPATCGRCHADRALMAEFQLPVEVVEEYRHSVHGELLLQQHDTGAPTCATCHGNHAATPPGFATVGAVCGKCHLHASKNFETSVHAGQSEFRGCVQCHGGGPGRHFHLVERITKPTGVMIQRYAHLMSHSPGATPQEVTAAVHPDPKQIIQHALPTCTECHEDPADDKSLPKLLTLLDDIAEAERTYLRTAQRLEQVGQGVLLVDHARFAFEDARTHLIELAPLQHTLDNAKVNEKVAELVSVCDQVNRELDHLEQRLGWRYRSLVVVWAFAAAFSLALYLKYKRLRKAYVVPLPESTR